MDSIQIQEFRNTVINTLPEVPNVYVLGDFHGAAIYVGMSEVDGRDRPRRHTTSARSDIIANRFVSVGEIAFIDIYIPPLTVSLKDLEAERLFTLNSHRPLFNTKIPKSPPEEISVPEPIRFQILPDCELTRMKGLTNTVLHHATQLHRLMEYISDAKNNAATKRALTTRHNLFTYHLERYLDAA